MPRPSAWKKYFCLDNIFYPGQKFLSNLKKYIFACEMDGKWLCSHEKFLSMAKNSFSIHFTSKYIHFLRFPGFFYSAELDVVFSSDVLALDLCTKKNQVQVRLMENLQQIFFHLRWKNICWRWKKICWIFPLFSTFSFIFS